MSIELMLEALEKEASIEKNKIREESETQIQLLQNQTKSEIEKSRDEIMTKAKEEMDMEEAKMLGNAKSQSNQLLLESRRKAFDNVYANAQERIQKTSKESDYPQILESLLQESLKNLTGKVTIEVSAKDVSLVQNLLKQLHKEADVHSNPKVLNGVVVKTADHKLIIENTLDNRLSKAMSNLTTEVVKNLWPSS